jgi:hypothetical protein
MDLAPLFPISISFAYQLPVGSVGEMGIGGRPARKLRNIRKKAYLQNPSKGVFYKDRLIVKSCKCRRPDKRLGFSSACAGKEAEPTLGRSQAEPGNEGNFGLKPNYKPLG